MPSPMKLIVDCAGGEDRYVKLTPEEIERHADVQAEAAERAAADEAAAADQQAALEELRKKAKVNPDVALLARALGVEVTS